MSYSKKRTDIQVATAKWLARRKLSTQMRIGRILGRLFYYLPNKRKTIARINIGLCFPYHSKQQASQLLKQNLLSTGQGVIEMMAALWSASLNIVLLMMLVVLALLKETAMFWRNAGGWPAQLREFVSATFHSLFLCSLYCPQDSRSLSLRVRE